MARNCVSTLLAGLILSCPFLCGADEVDHAAHAPHDTSGPCDPSSPVHCPQESEDCICQGAIPTIDSRVDDLHLLGMPCGFRAMLGLPPHAVSHSLIQLSRVDTAAGLAGWGGCAQWCPRLAARLPLLRFALAHRDR